MAKEFFPQIGKIPFEGPESKNVMAFHYYDPEKIVMGKKMKDWLRFAMAWWHSLGAASSDQFGGQTRSYEWDKAECPMQRAKDKLDAGFEIMQKLGIEYYCFHDVDLVEEGDSIAEYEARMQEITDYALEKMKESNIKLLWGTANVFGHKRYMNGAATNPDFDVVARADKDRHRRHHQAGRRKLRVLGRKRRLHEPVEHTNAAREGPSGQNADCRTRLCPRQGIQRHIPH